MFRSICNFREDLSLLQSGLLCRVYILLKIRSSKSNISRQKWTGISGYHLESLCFVQIFTKRQNSSFSKLRAVADDNLHAAQMFLLFFFFQLKAVADEKLNDNIFL